MAEAAERPKWEALATSISSAVSTAVSGAKGGEVKEPKDD